MIKIFRSAGHYLAGLVLKIDTELRFVNTNNPEITTFDSFTWKLKTALINSFRITDLIKVQDVVNIDTLNDIVKLGDNYTPIGFDKKKIVFIAFTGTSYVASFGEDINVDCTLGNVSIILPNPTLLNKGQSLSITKNDASVNVVNYSVVTGLILSNATPNVVSQYNSKTFISNGTNIGLR